MAELRIDADLCKGCRVCMGSCASGALHLENGIAVVDDACVLCGVCVNTCPFGAIAIETQEKSTSDGQGVWVLTQCLEGTLLPVSLELLGIGRRLADEKGCELVAVVLDKGGRAYAKPLIHHGADRVLLCAESGLTCHQLERCAEILDSLIQAKKPEILLIGATGYGRALAPRMAVTAQTGLTADCTALSLDKETGCLRQTRPAFGGNLMATIVCPHARPQMATVRPGVMAMAPCDVSRQGVIEVVHPPKPKAQQVWVIDSVCAPAVDSIATAEKLVVVGRGIGGKKNMKLAEAFAQKIGAKVAVSRPLVDMGYAPYAQQVGQTGATVAPKLLISLGVSGAIQHLAGISRAETIIAINADEEAPIFAVSQYRIVTDCVSFLKAALD